MMFNPLTASETLPVRDINSLSLAVVHETFWKPASYLTPSSVLIPSQRQ